MWRKLSYKKINQLISTADVFSDLNLFQSSYSVVGWTVVDPRRSPGFSISETSHRSSSPNPPGRSLPYFDRGKKKSALDSESDSLGEFSVSFNGRSAIKLKTSLNYRNFEILRLIQAQTPKRWWNMHPRNQCTAAILLLLLLLQYLRAL